MKRLARNLSILLSSVRPTVCPVDLEPALAVYSVIRRLLGLSFDFDRYRSNSPSDAGPSLSAERRTTAIASASGWVELQRGAAHSICLQPTNDGTSLGWAGLHCIASLGPWSFGIGSDRIVRQDLYVGLSLALCCCTGAYHGIWVRPDGFGLVSRRAIFPKGG